MAVESNVNFTGNVDITSMFTGIANANPDSPFIQEFFISLANPLIEKIKESKIEGIKLDLGSLFGINTQASNSVKNEFNRATKALLKKIQEQVSKVNTTLSTEFNLGSLIGTTPQFKASTNRVYQSTVRQYLNILQASLANIKKIGISSNLTLAGLIGSTPQFSAITKGLYEWTVTRIFKKIRKLATDLKFSEDFNLLEFIGGSQELSSWSKHQYQNTIRTLFKKIGNLDIENFVKESVGTVEGTSKITKNPPKPHLTEKENAIYDQVMVSKNRDKSNTFVSDFEKKPEVVVSGFSARALNELKKILPKSKIGEELLTGISKSQLGKGSGKFGIWDVIKDVIEGLFEISIAGLFTSAVLTGAGIAALVKGLYEHGPLKGSWKLLGDIILRIEPYITKFVTSIGKIIPRAIGKTLEWVTDKIHPGLAKTLFGRAAKEAEKVGAKTIAKRGALKLTGKVLAKKIPIIGAIAGLAFGISRFLDGDVYGGLLEFASGLASIVPGYGTGVSLGIDALLAYRDWEGGGPAEIGKAHPNVKKASNILWDFLKVHEPIRTLYRYSDSLGKMASGNYKEGIKGLLNLMMEVEGIATGSAVLLEFFDTPSPAETTEATRATNALKTDFMPTLYDMFKDKWPFTALRTTALGFLKINNGDILGGLKMISEGMMGGELTPLTDFLGMDNTPLGYKIASAIGLAGPGSKAPASQPKSIQSSEMPGPNLNDHVISPSAFEGKGALKSIGEQFDEGFTNNTKILTDVNTSIGELLLEFKKASKGIQVIAEKDPHGSTQISNVNHPTPTPSPISDQSSRINDSRNAVVRRFR